jgi:hypothetical protein
MRWFVVTLVFAASAVGVAVAQDFAGRQWEELPSARTFVRARPERSRNEGVAGYSLLCCAVRSDRRLDCEVAVAWPSGYGFDRAAQTVARDFRLSESSYAAMSPDTRIRQSIVWQVSERTPELQAALDQIHEATKTTCTPAGTEASPADDIVVTTERIGGQHLSPGR